MVVLNELPLSELVDPSRSVVPKAELSGSQYAEYCTVDPESPVPPIDNCDPSKPTGSVRPVWVNEIVRVDADVDVLVSRVLISMFPIESGGEPAPVETLMPQTPTDPRKVIILLWEFKSPA